MAVAACVFAVMAGSVALGSSGAVARDTSMPEESVSATGISELIQKTIEVTTPSSAELKVLERSIVAGRIAEADYETSHRSYSKCMAASGFEPTYRKSSSGFYVELPYLHVQDPEALNAAMTKCSSSTTAITSLYRTQQANPNLVQDSRMVAVKCLQDNESVDSKYTAETFEKEWAASSFSFDADEVSNNDCLYGAGYAYFTFEE